MKSRMLASLLLMLSPALAHAHEHHAPHGGCLVEVGEEFAHLELVLDRDSSELTAYALDGEAEAPVRLKQRIIALEFKGRRPWKIELRARANSLTGETAGATSEFSAAAKRLRRASSFEGRVSSLQIRGHTFYDLPFRCSSKEVK